MLAVAALLSGAAVTGAGAIGGGGGGRGGVVVTEAGIEVAAWLATLALLLIFILVEATAGDAGGGEII